MTSDAATVLRAVAGLGVAVSLDEALLALRSAGSELLLSGSGFVVVEGRVHLARPEGLAGAECLVGDGSAGVWEVHDLHIDGKDVGPAVVLGLPGHHLVWAGIPEGAELLVERVAPLEALGRAALQRIERAQRRKERIARRLDGSEALVVALVESTIDPVWVLDDELNLTTFNRAFVDLMIENYSLEPCVGMSLDHLPEPHRSRHGRIYRRVLRKGATRIDWSTPDRSRVFDVSLHPIQVEQSNVGIAVYCRDVTEARRSQALLARALEDAEGANRAKSAFLAQMSHEIRTPLNAIVGLTDLTLGSGLTDHQRDLLTKVKTNSNALLHLVSGILDFSRIEAGEMDIRATPMDFARMVVDAVDMLRHRAGQRGLELVVEIEDGFPTRVMGDEHRLRQVLVNLVENALKYTDEGRVDVTVGLEDHNITMSVSDTGWGIPEEEQLRIFERFHRAEGVQHVAGVGLGLAITLDLVQRMDGTIEIESEAGAGTTFHVTFPLDVVRWEEGPGATRTDLRRLGRCLEVLVVDDGPDNLDVTTALLERVGHRVTPRSSGLQALEAVKARRFDLVLMDVHMPAPDGPETSRRLRAAGFTEPIVALTAHARPEVAAQCRAAGMDGFLTKPVRAATLEEEVLRFSRNPRVLVVDDSPEARLLLRLWLQRAGVDVVEAAGIEDALALAVGPYDAFLVDHDLFDGTGPDLVQQLGERGYRVPYAAISSTDRATLAEEWPDADTQITKPFTQDAVLNATSLLLRKRFAEG